ncbi:hypothetical protein F5Y03DRAFT_103999 [Xylaria venustula]|nr:hypothetical protein F5Y03DRAFT_103999 [Xylaria venustula]
MSSGRAESPTQMSLLDKEFGTYRQDSSGSDTTTKGKHESSGSDSSHWYKRYRSKTESDSHDSHDSHRSHRSHGSHSSYDSHDSNDKHGSPTVNLYTHCGRHTDQYLFGGHSLSDAIKDILKKKH